MSVKNIFNIIFFQFSQDVLIGDFLMIDIADKDTEIRRNLVMTDIPLMKVGYLKEHKTYNSIQKQYNESIDNY